MAYGYDAVMVVAEAINRTLSGLTSYQKGKAFRERWSLNCARDWKKYEIPTISKQLIYQIKKVYINDKFKVCITFFILYRLVCNGLFCIFDYQC